MDTLVPALLKLRCYLCSTKNMKEKLLKLSNQGGSQKQWFFMTGTPIVRQSCCKTLSNQHIYKIPVVNPCSKSNCIPLKKLRHS